MLITFCSLLKENKLQFLLSMQLNMRMKHCIMRRKEKSEILYFLSMHFYFFVPISLSIYCDINDVFMFVKLWGLKITLDLRVFFSKLPFSLYFTAPRKEVHWGLHSVFRCGTKRIHVFHMEDQRESQFILAVFCC